MIKFTFDEAEIKAIKEKLGSQNFMKAIDVALVNIGEEMANEARDNAPYKTGSLRRSIISKPTKTKVEVGTDLEYARIHDLGGTISAHTITPRNAKALRFMIGGKEIFVKSVNKPARIVKPYKGKGYLTPAFNRMKNGRAIDILSKEVNFYLK